MAFLKHKVRTEVEEDKLKNELDQIVTGEKPMTANERMLQLAKTNSYIDRFEQILKEREDEDKFSRARHERFENMKAIMGTLKDNLISAAYPRGGGEHLKYSTVIGVPKDEVPNSRAKDKYTSFQSLHKPDPQTQKIKEIATKFDLPKRIEIKELELALMQIVQFSELNNGKKKRVCKEIAFIIKDLTAMYNMCNEGAPQI